MRTIVSEFAIGQYKVLTLDGTPPNREYRKYIIEDTVFDIVPLYDIPNSIAIESKGSFVGKKVKFE